MNIPANLKYTEDHEWIRVEGNEAYIGVTDYAQSQLGDIVFVEIETLDQTLEKGETFGTIEAVKTVSDLFMPASGKIIEVNSSLNDKPEIVNSDPYGQGWMIKIELTKPSEIEGLLSTQAYQEIIG
jgi:glycine cleavage system H protein